MKKNIAVILSGCGVYDGAEITEAVSTLIALSKAGADYQCFSLDQNKTHIIDHTKGEVADESRNILVESARIARGNVKEISTLSAKDYDGIIFPGGFGVAKNFCDFAFKGNEMSVKPEIESVLKDFHSVKKPIGLICISPVLGAKVFGAEVTIGNDAGTAEAISALGGKNHDKEVTEIHFDEKNKLFTAPAYMYDSASPYEVYLGIEKLVAALLQQA